jgi:hypothetical protein
MVYVLLKSLVFNLWNFVSIVSFNIFGAEMKFSILKENTDNLCKRGVGKQEYNIIFILQIIIQFIVICQIEIEFHLKSKFKQRKYLLRNR